MKFPERPTVHKVDSVFRVADDISWRPPRENESFRSCSFCGCIHPEDLLRLIEVGAQLGGSDWKYGWPHKFYLTRDKQPGEDRGLWAKWYNEHLEDVGFDDEALAKLLKALEQHGGIRFEFIEKDGQRVLKYAAPHRGYQR